MSALRKAIRKEIVRRLKGRTAAGSRVRANRGEVNWQENLPGINVYVRGETLEELTNAPRAMRRFLDVEIEIIDEGQDGERLSDQLDDLAEQVERCLSVDDSINGCADDILLQTIGDIDVDTSGSKPTGSIRLGYQVKYHEFAPRDRKGQGVFETLETIDAEWDLQPGQDEDDRAKDTITIP